MDDSKQPHRVVLTKNTNYAHWHMFLTSDLKRSSATGGNNEPDYFAHIDPATPSVAATPLAFAALTAPQQARFTKAEAHCVSLLVKTVDAFNFTKIQRLANEHQASRAMFAALCAYHQQASSATQSRAKGQLRTTLATFKFGQPIDDFIQACENHYNTLLLAGGTMTEQDFLTDVLQSLPREYDTEKPSIRNLPANEFTINNVFSKIATADTNIKLDRARRGEGGAPVEEKESVQALYTSKFKTQDDKIDALLKMVEQLVGKKTNNKNDVCQNFLRHGTCKFGDNCKYQHVKRVDSYTDTDNTSANVTTVDVPSYSFAL
jgi:hypothetical protein